MTDYIEKLIADRPVTIRRRILWGDCDPAAVVYTPRFGDYFVSARDWFLRVGIGFLDRPHPKTGGLSFPMRALAYDFKSFLVPDDLIDMRVFVTLISKRTFTIQVLATHETGRKVFTVTGTQVCFDRDKGEAALLPTDIIAGLEAYKSFQGQ